MREEKKKKEARWDEGSQKAEAEQGGNTKLWLLDGLQQRKDPLFFKIQNSISLLQKHIVAALARKMKRCFSIQDEQPCVGPAAPVKKSNSEVSSPTFLQCLFC